jgi:hypothetical protein
VARLAAARPAQEAPRRQSLLTGQVVSCSLDCGPSCGAMVSPLRGAARPTHWAFSRPAGSAAAPLANPPARRLRGCCRRAFLADPQGCRVD